jgi:DNA-binding response OmpR family regulator
MSEQQPRLLIVDDEVDACLNLSDILTDMDYTVDVAHDGPTALELVKLRSYDVALLDLKMPGMDGVELYKRIKAVSAGTVAIVVTAFAGSQIAQDALDTGVTEVLAKPVDLQRLLRRIEAMLDQPLVLIVDDDTELCTSLWDVLREHGYRTAIAHHAADAEAKLRQQAYQIVLIDMRLPVGSGAEVFRLVRNTHDSARTILITGYRSETEGQIATVLAEGADAVAYKPFDVRSLLGTLSQLSKKSNGADSGR